MGMVMTFYALSSKNLAELVAHPDRLPAFQRTNEEDQKRRSSWGAEKYEKFIRDQQSYAKQYRNPWIAYEPRKKGYKSLFRMDLQKSWHGIHFLLTGRDGERGFFSGLFDSSLSSPVFGGEKIGDGGSYGENRYFTARQVREIHAFLSGRSIETWGKNYDPAKMMALNIYPEVWKREGQKAYDDFLLPNLQGLISFFEEAAGQNLAVFKVMD